MQETHDLAMDALECFKPVTITTRSGTTEIRVK